MKSDNLLARWNDLEIEEREHYTRVMNYLLEHTFLLSRQYGTSEMGQRGANWNDDYTFALSEFEALKFYFVPLGFELRKEERDGMIFLDRKSDDTIDISWDSILALYALRLLYDERLAQIMDVLKNVPVSVEEVMDVLARFNKDFSNKSGTPVKGRIKRALSPLFKHNIATKIDTGDISASTMLLIHPTITVVLDNEKIRELSDYLSKESQEKDEDNDENT